MYTKASAEQPNMMPYNRADVLIATTSVIDVKNAVRSEGGATDSGHGNPFAKASETIPATHKSDQHEHSEQRAQ